MWSDNKPKENCNESIKLAVYDGKSISKLPLVMKIEIVVRS
jgi:hypothetical protein